MNFGTNPNLRIQSNLSSFVAVLWVSSSSETISPSVAGMLSQYVRYGGELVTTDSVLDNLSALAPVAVTNASAAPVVNGSSFLQAALIPHRIRQRFLPGDRYQHDTNSAIGHAAHFY